MFDFCSPPDKGLIIVQSENSIAIKSIDSETPVVSDWQQYLAQCTKPRISSKCNVTDCHPFPSTVACSLVTDDPTVSYPWSPLSVMELWTLSPFIPGWAHKQQYWEGLSWLAHFPTKYGATVYLKEASRSWAVSWHVHIPTKFKL